MRKLLLLSLLAMLSLVVKAQGDTYWRLYPKVGVNLSKFPNDIIYVGFSDNKEQKTRYKQGLTAGAEVSCEHHALSASLGLMYSNRGTKYNDFTYEDATEQERVSGIQYTLHYLEMPLMVGYELAEGFKVKAGIQPGYLLKAKFMEDRITSEKLKEGQMKVVSTEDVDIECTDLFKRFDFSIPIGISYEYSNVVIDARYVIGITDNSKYFKARNSGFTFTVGYGFDL